MTPPRAEFPSSREPSSPTLFDTVTLVACVALGLLFVVFGALKVVLPPPEHARLALGDERWIHVLVGVVEVGGGLFLLWPRTVPVGASIMAMFLLSLVSVAMLRGDRSPLLLIPLLVLVGVIVIGYLRHPGRLAGYRLRSAMDRYAEQQLRKERKRRPPQNQTAQRLSV
jgi:hypothetical protein